MQATKRGSVVLMRASSSANVKQLTPEEAQEAFDELLSAEEEKIKELEAGLAESSRLTAAAVEVLMRFDKKVDLLEASMQTLNDSIQPIRQRQSNISSVLERILAVMERLNIANEVEPHIRQGPSGDFASYAAYMGRLREAEEFLTGPAAGYRSAPKVLEHVSRQRAVQNIGVKQCEQRLLAILKAVSASIQPLQVEPLKPKNVTSLFAAELALKQAEEVESRKREKAGKQAKTQGSGEAKLTWTPVSKEKLTDMAFLLKTISAQRSMAGGSEWMKQYTKTRARFILDSVKSCKINDAMLMLSLEHSIYQKGTHPFLYLMHVVGVLISAEYRLAEKLLGSLQENGVTRCLEEICAPTISFMLDIGTSFLHLREYAREFQHFAWLDMLANLKNSLVLYNRTLGQNPAKPGKMNACTEVVSFCGSLQLTCKNALESFVRHLRASALQPPRPDCNVTQLTSTTLSYLKQLFSYSTIILEILPCPPGASRTPQILTDFVCDTIDELVDAMRSQAGRIEKLPASIFLINNSNHILKTVQEHPDLSKHADAKLLRDLSTRFDAEMSKYRTCWNPCFECLLNTKGGTKNWSASKYKTRITQFNDSMEELYAAQQQLVIPDKELRERVISEIRTTIMPLYEAFLSNMNEVVSEEKREKYVKFSAATLGKMFDHILAGSEPARPTKKAGLNKTMLKPYLDYF